MTRTHQPFPFFIGIGPNVTLGLESGILEIMGPEWPESQNEISSPFPKPAISVYYNSDMIIVN